MQESSGEKRINLLYLMDSVIQTSQRRSRPNCGPGSEIGTTFRKLGAAALPSLISSVAVELEGLEKAKKVRLCRVSGEVLVGSLMSGGAV
jgi:CID domain